MWPSGVEKLESLRIDQMNALGGAFFRLEVEEGDLIEYLPVSDLGFRGVIS